MIFKNMYLQVPLLCQLGNCLPKLPSFHFDILYLNAWVANQLGKRAGQMLPFLETNLFQTVFCFILVSPVEVLLHNLFTVSL